MTGVLVQSKLPLPLLRRGKVREVYEVDGSTLLLVASDRVSAFDVVMREAVPHKGAVLTQMSAFWFERLKSVMPHHLLSADVEAIVARVPTLAPHRDELQGRAMLTRRATTVPFECVVRGYISGSAWAEYKQSGTLAGEPMPKGLVESAQLDPPIFSPATKAEQGHDENVTFDHVVSDLGRLTAERLRGASLALYEAGRDSAAQRGIIIADTKFEFGTTPDGELLVIDEILTPDSSRFWPADRYQPGKSQPSFDKQPLPGRSEEAGKMEWRGSAAAAAGRGRERDQRTLPGRLSAHHGEGTDGWPMIARVNSRLGIDRLTDGAAFAAVAESRLLAAQSIQPCEDSARRMAVHRRGLDPDTRCRLAVVAAGCSARDRGDLGDRVLSRSDTARTTR